MSGGWFSRFFRLLYVSYLYSEQEIKNFAFLILGAVLGMFMLSIVSPPIEVPIEYQWLAAYNGISLWNWGIALIWVIQAILSIIIVTSMVRVAYIYDNKSWGYVHDAYTLWHSLVQWIETLNTRLDKDADEHDTKREELLKTVKEEIEKIKV